MKRPRTLWQVLPCAVNNSELFVDISIVARPKLEINMKLFNIKDSIESQGSGQYRLAVA